MTVAEEVTIPRSFLLLETRFVTRDRRGKRRGGDVFFATAVPTAALLALESRSHSLALRMIQAVQLHLPPSGWCSEDVAKSTAKI